MQKRTSLILVLPLFFAAWLPSTLLGIEPGDEADTPTTPAALVDAIRDVLHETKVPGVGLAIASRDEVLVSEGIGFANVAAQQPVTTGTMFRAGSISKSFTALALLKLQEAGQVNLDERLSELIPEVQVDNRWDKSAPLRLVHLLEHTSGFDEIPLSQFAKSVPGITMKESVHYDANRRIARWQPGTFFSYSNANYTLAGYVVEKVSGQDFDDYLTSELLQPLDTSKASFLLTDYVREHIATGYSADGVSARPYEHIVGRSSGALNCTATQLAHLVQMLLNRGRFAGQQILEQASVERMETPTTCITAQHGLIDGYGLANFTYAVDGHRLHGHAGAMDGFLASYAYSPEFGMGYSVMINSSNGQALRRIETLIQAYLSREWPEAVHGTAANSSPEYGTRFDGYYQPYTLRMEQSRFLYRLLMLTRVKSTGHGLQIGGLLGDPESYLPTELAGGFRRVDDPGTTLLFVDHEDEAILASAEDRGHENLRRMAGWSFWGQTSCIGFCVLAMLSSLLLSLVWVPVWFFRRPYDRKQIVIRLLPAATVFSFLSFLGIICMCLGDPVVLLATPTVWSVGVMLLTYLYAALTIACLCLVVISRKWNVPSWIWWHTGLVTTANALVLLYLSYWGIIGLRTWA